MTTLWHLWRAKRCFKATIRWLDLWSEGFKNDFWGEGSSYGNFCCDAARGNLRDATRHLKKAA